MSLSNSVIQNLRKIVGEANLLTDPEDLYVYSFEHFFTKTGQYRKLSAVVKVASEEQAKQVMELAGKEDVSVLRRSKEIYNTFQPESAFTVLIDDSIMPQLDVLPRTAEKARCETDYREQIRKSVPGSFHNYALALKSFFHNLPSSKCIDCNVCSGYCTVSPSFNGVETWSSKGRTLLTRALTSGELQPTPKLVDVLYTCSLCGLCFAQCFETTEVRKAIMDARHRLADKKQVPEMFTATAKNIFEIGDPSGMPRSKRLSWTQQLQQKGTFPEKAETLYWAGCIVSTRTPKAAKALGNILHTAQVNFTFLGEKEGCCGYVLLASGLWNEARQNALRLVDRVKETGAETLVTPCAGCYYTFTKMYPEILDIEMPCQVSHASQFVENLINEGRITLGDVNMRVTYHDPCSLGRHSGVYKSPRNVLRAVPSLDFAEMPLSKNRSRCCGAGGGLWSFNNQVATNSAVERLIKDVAPMGVSALVTTCPTCNINFRNASARKSLKIRVYDLMEIVESATQAAPKA